MQLDRLVSVVALFLGACCSTASPEPVDAKILIAGEHSAIEVASVEELRGEDEWRGWWARHVAGGMSKDEPPPVDWERDLVVAVTLGARPTLGYGLDLVGASRDAGVALVLLREREPSPEMLQAQVMTHPFACVVLPRGEVEVVVE
jgi:hypothetical protein